MLRASNRRIAFFTAAACLGAASLAAQETGERRSLQELWQDPSVFLPEFFPETQDLPVEEILIAGLESHFPNRVSREEPTLTPGPPREPLVLGLAPGVSYVRVYELGAALPALREEIRHNALVIDLRNVQARRDDVMAFGEIVTINETVRLSLTEHFGIENSGTGERDFVIEAAGLRRPLQPVFVLSNTETAGPLEVLLAELKDKGQIVSIGTRTAGRTGRFRAISETPPLHILSGELRPASGASLLETGFVPSVSIDVSPADDRRAYRALEEGESLLALVGAEPPENDEPEPADLRELLDDADERGPDADGEVVDVILQRAYFIVTALRSIGKIASPASE